MMQETLKSAKRNKILLEDYDFRSDISNRVLLSTFTQTDYQVLEEILYSPIQFSLEKLAQNLELDENEVLKTVQKLEPTKLFLFDGAVLTVNKEKRKYFEIHVEKFDDDFSPGMDYLQSLLKCVPIDVLPVWYHIPRSSNNIFDSVLEKYLHTPQIYQRYLVEFFSGDDLVRDVVTEVFHSKESQIPFKDLMARYSLSHEEMTELAIYLEFSLVCVTKLVPSDDGWEEVLCPFAEWSKYQHQITHSVPNSISDEASVTPSRDDPYAFVEDMKKTLELGSSTALQIQYDKERDAWEATQASCAVIEKELGLANSDPIYVSRLINKLLILGLAVIEETDMALAPPAEEWMNTPAMKRAHITFKHPHNFLAMQKNYPLTTQRAVLEIEKSISNVSGLGWVYFDEFLEGSQIALNEDQKVVLKQVGRNWQYSLPEYSEQEAQFIKMIVLEWLFEGGVVQVGTFEDRDCFRLTPLGESLFV